MTSSRRLLNFSFSIRRELVRRSGVRIARLHIQGDHVSFSQLRRRPSLFVFAGMLSVALFVACSGDSDQRTEQLSPGIARDSALKLLVVNLPGSAAGADADTLKNIW